MSSQGGRQWGFWAYALLLAVSALILQPLPASASDGHRSKRDRPYLIPEFEVPATNGYRVEVFWIAGHHGKPDRVGVLAWNSISSTSYVGPGQVSQDRVRASLGKYGAVNVSFERQGVRRVRSLCGRGVDSFVAGVYKGTVEFEGDEGFTQAIDPELEAEPLFHDPWECSGVEVGYGAGPGVYLRVYSRYGETVVVQNAPGRPVRYEALAEGRSGQIEIGRMVEVIGPSSGFHWSQSLKRATVSPPPPFSGTATYRDLGGRVTHREGDLHVDFPGFRDYPLNPGPSLTEFTHGDCHVYLPPSNDPHPLSAVSKGGESETLATLSPGGGQRRHARRSRGEDCGEAVWRRDATSARRRARARRCRRRAGSWREGLVRD
jgi:hypothetical protein